MLDCGTFEDATLMSDKQRLRNLLRAQRSQLNPTQQIEKSKQLAEVIVTIPEFIKCQTLAAYYPFDNEISPLPLLEVAHAMGKQCFLPVLSTSNAFQLTFVEYQPGDPLTPNRFGIQEPFPNTRPSIPAPALELVLLPLVAFDDKSRRLGMGKGYYDKTFAFLKEVKISDKHPRLIGLAYELQRVAELPQDTWDICLSGIATEQNYLDTQITNF